MNPNLGGGMFAYSVAMDRLLEETGRNDMIPVRVTWRGGSVVSMLLPSGAVWHLGGDHYPSGHTSTPVFSRVAIVGLMLRGQMRAGDAMVYYAPRSIPAYKHEERESFESFERRVFIETGLYLGELDLKVDTTNQMVGNAWTDDYNPFDPYIGSPHGVVIGIWTNPPHPGGGPWPLEELLASGVQAVLEYAFVVPDYRNLLDTVLVEEELIAKHAKWIDGY